MTTPTLNRPTNPTAGGAETKQAIIQDEDATTPVDIHRRGDFDKTASANQSVRKASTTAGVGLLLMAGLSALGYLVAVKGLVIPGDAARTARSITDHQGLFRFGILSLYLVATLDVVVAWALYRMFKPMSKGIAMLAGWLRVAYAGVFVVAISQLIGALRLLGIAGQSGAAHSGQLQAQALLHINTFTNIWDAGLVLFGLHLFVLAYLAYRLGYVPNLLGFLLGIAGFGYVFDTFSRVLARGSSSDVSAITGIGEIMFGLWLVSCGRCNTSSDAGCSDDTIGIGNDEVRVRVRAASMDRDT